MVGKSSFMHLLGTLFEFFDWYGHIIPKEEWCGM